MNVKQKYKFIQITVFISCITAFVNKISNVKYTFGFVIPKLAGS